ncbi:MAG: hypothetical protein KGL39_22655 [Patescibacteria group bacterium]|nr:hypothetical protein [Patescibacteria group bacterium]
MSRKVTLSSCQPGLFLFDGELCLKSEYFTKGSADAYLTANGEYFWGGTSDRSIRDQFLVEPIEVDIVMIEAYRLLAVMAARGQSVSLNWGEDDGLWECSWITGGQRHTALSTNMAMAVKQAHVQAVVPPKLKDMNGEEVPCVYDHSRQAGFCAITQQWKLEPCEHVRAVNR